MFQPIVLLLAGGVMLYFGAEWLVSAASGLARAFGIPELLVGLTVVAYGTSAPEVVVGIQAAAAGHGDIALGNVLGSNIANLGLILGVAALIKPARVNGFLGRREVPVMVLSAFLVPAALWHGRIEVWMSALLLAASIAYTAWMVLTSRNQAGAKQASHFATVEQAAAEAAGAPPQGSRRRGILIALVGLAVLVLGGSVFVDAASSLAKAFGISERIVGLTIVAVGTSLPELATSLIAAFRGYSDIAVGNVVGSNIFNIFLCLGAAGLFGNIEASLGKVALDVGAMIAMTLIGAVLLRTERTLRRWEGALLLASYTAFMAAVAMTQS
jgi:cation:H+ antiporter